MYQSPSNSASSATPSRIAPPPLLAIATIARFPPYNHHFLHDVGAFQIGLGATLLLAVWFRDALVVALGGYTLGAVAHAAAHVLDRDLGGNPSDPLSLTILALVALTAVLLYASRKEMRP